MIPQGHQVGDKSHERRDVDVLALVMIVTLLLLILATCFLGVWGVTHFFNREHWANASSRKAADQAQTFPAPRLEVTPGLALAKDRVTQETELNSYGWMDRKQGTVHIPIAQAMKLLVERGLPDVGAGQTRLQLMQSRPQTDVQPNHPVVAPTAEATP